MPQPLPRGTKINFDFRPDRVLERPILAPYITCIALHWNEIESHLGVFLAALCGQEAETVIRIFLALQTDGGRRATLDTILSMKLGKDDLASFQEIQRQLGARYAERNKAIHGAWGVSSDYPDALLWYDPRDSVAMFPGLTSAAAQANVDAIRERMDKANQTMRVYKERDLQDILSRFRKTYSLLREFTAPYVSLHFQTARKVLSQESAPQHE